MQVRRRQPLLLLRRVASLFANPTPLRLRTTIWQGSADKSVPPSHAKWYKQEIPGATLNLLEGEGHVTVPVRYAAKILHSGFTCQ